MLTGFRSPRGINAYPLLELAGRRDWIAVDSIFDQALAMGRNVVRCNAFHFARPHEDAQPSHTLDPWGAWHEPGFVALDHLLVRARQRDVRLVFTLSNHWDDYGGGAVFAAHTLKTTKENISSFYKNTDVIDAYIDYVVQITQRVNTLTGVPYADEPAILAWELCNEPRHGFQYGSPHHVLTQWAREVSQALKATAITQPIAWGGHGFFGEFGEHSERIAEITSIDILTLHVYPEPFLRDVKHPDTLSEVLNVATTEGILKITQFAKRLAGCTQALWVEEMGWPRGVGPHVDQERALLFAAWQTCAHALDMAFFPWMIAEEGRPDFDGYLIKANHTATREALASHDRDSHVI